MNQKSLDKKKTKELDWEKEWNKLTVKSYNLKTEKYEDEPIIFVNDKSWKKVKNFIQSLLTQQRKELLEEIEEVVKNLVKGRKLWLEDGSLAPDFGVIPELKQYNQAIKDMLSIIRLLNKKDESIE